MGHRRAENEMSAIDARELFRIHRTPEGDAAALQGLTLAIEPGEVVAVLGPSGSGKSTLMRILAGLERPSAGTAVVLGADMGSISRHAAAALRSRRMGVVDQHFRLALPPDLPCAAAITLQMAMLGAPAAERRRRSAELLERVGLPDAAAAALPGELSGGEAQRVAICAAVAHRPALLLADEPAGELDAAGVTVTYGLIGEMAREDGATVVLVSHDPAAAEVADRTVHIRDGRLSDEAARTGQASIVVGRGGWLRIPEEMLRAAGIGRLATAETHADGIVLAASGGGAAPAATPAHRPAQEQRSGAAAEVRGVTVRYGSGRRAHDVLDGLTATFRAGRLTAVTGRSGSGKSTLLRLLAGLEHPSAGEVTVAGVRLETLSRAGAARFRRDHVAVVSQEAGLVGHLSAAENVALALAARGRRDPDAVLEWLDRLGLGHRTHQRVERLSAGERQRAAIARALACSPDVALIDEPTSRLDHANAAVVAELLADAAGLHGATVVVATHDPVLIERADDVVALEPRPPR
jgi:ABC-type lipoprotein export system ATPase subunit